MVQKALPGIIRLVFEDVPNGICQVIFLIKMYHKISFGMRAFTLGQLAISIFLAAASPMQDMTKASAARFGFARCTQSGDLSVQGAFRRPNGRPSNVREVRPDYTAVSDGTE